MLPVIAEADSPKTEKATKGGSPKTDKATWGGQSENRQSDKGEKVGKHAEPQGGYSRITDKGTRGGDGKPTKPIGGTVGKPTKPQGRTVDKKEETQSAEGVQ